MTASTDGEGLHGAIGHFQLFSLAFGAILGAGWIIAVGDWIQAAGPAGTIIAFTCGAAVLSMIALCYADLGVLHPVTGGEVVYAERLFNREIAYYTGWFLAIVYISVCAFSAISLGWIIEGLMPGSSGPALYRILGRETHAAGLCAGVTAIAAVATVHYLGVRAATRLQDGLAVLMIAAFVAFAAAGIHAGRPGNLAPWFGSDDTGRHWPGMLQVFISAPFWFSGFAVVSQALGEQASTARRRALGPVFLVAINAACLFYCLVVIAVAGALPRQEMLGLDLPAAGAFLRSLHSKSLADLVLGIGLLGLLNALNAIFFSASRVLYALARGGYLPAWLGAVSHRTGAPAAAGALVAILALLGTALGRGAINPLVDAAAIILSFIYLMVCLAALRARRRAGRKSLASPVLASTATVGLIVAALFMSLRDATSSIPPDLALIGAAIVLGVAFRYGHRQSRPIRAVEPKLPKV
jgi:APA family basic amino acid/polyamine antiporter